MPRIPYPDPATLPPADRALLDNLPPLNITRMLAGSPSVFQPLTRLFSAYLSNGMLSDDLREIVILRTGHLCGSEYEVINHERVARQIGMPAEKISALRPGAEAGQFSAEEHHVLRFVDEVVREGGASQASFTAVEQFMSPAEIIEMTVIVGVYTLVSQVCATFAIEPEDPPITGTGIGAIRDAISRLDD